MFKQSMCVKSQIKHYILRLTSSFITERLISLSGIKEVGELLVFKFVIKYYGSK